MPSNQWDSCTLESDLIAQIDLINQYYGDSEVISDDSSDVAQKEINNDVARTNGKMGGDLQQSLQEAESVCRMSLETLDNILMVLNGVGDAYAEVTGRTNTLMMNCERLLEQQVVELNTFSVIVSSCLTL